PNGCVFACLLFFFSSRRRHTRWPRDWSSDVCSSDLVPLDGGGSVLRPAILWNDQRTAEECAWITKRVGAERVIELTGNPVLTGFTAPKIVWMRRHEPDLYARIAHILLPKDYVRYCLTGKHAVDAADAS